MSQKKRSGEGLRRVFKRGFRGFFFSFFLITSTFFNHQKVFLEKKTLPNICSIKTQEEEKTF